MAPWGYLLGNAGNELRVKEMGGKSRHAQSPETLSQWLRTALAAISRYYAAHTTFYSGRTQTFTA